MGDGAGHCLGHVWGRLELLVPKCLLSSARIFCWLFHIQSKLFNGSRLAGLQDLQHTQRERAEAKSTFNLLSAPKVELANRNGTGNGNVSFFVVVVVGDC